MHPLHQLYATSLVDPARITHDEPQLREAIPLLMSARAAILAAMENARQAKVLGASVGCSVRLDVPPDSRALQILKSLESELPTIFVVSSVDINVPDQRQEWTWVEPFEAHGAQCRAFVEPPKQHKCPRCWRYVAEKEDDLCGRCAEVVAKLAV